MLSASKNHKIHARKRKACRQGQAPADPPQRVIIPTRGLRIMPDSFTIPGDVIASIEEYEAGKNAFDDGDKVRAAGVGTAEFDKSSRVANIKVPRLLPIPDAGDTIIGSVAAVMTHRFAVSMKLINGRPITSGIECMCSTRNIRKSTVTLVNDIVVLKIIKRINGDIHAGMNDPSLGVLFTKCRKCGKDVIRNHDGLKKGRRDDRGDRRDGGRDFDRRRGDSFGDRRRDRDDFADRRRDREDGDRRRGDFGDRRRDRDDFADRRRDREDSGDRRRGDSFGDRRRDRDDFADRRRDREDSGDRRRGDFGDRRREGRDGGRGFDRRRSWDAPERDYNIKCTECGWVDERKLSSDFGNEKLLSPGV
ncbi:conserved hypothetical protein [Cenarchaeum symbiosum A]|uniref:Exosome complex component Csl4 n=1 Tax=Cenarchaeum symbiosum (strain A) TaxID=414004 RepID=A0RZ51_CENSY|nr:conserved hypothetical protein [Cenarchaeum symbiosum A]